LFSFAAKQSSLNMTFENLKLAPAILKAIQEQGYENPTPIQAQAIPLVLEGHDLLAGAQTGTGKTAAFTLPVLHKLTMSRSVTNQFGVYGVRALVLTPTRELAAQVEESVRAYGKYLQLSSTVIFGGVGMSAQINRIKKGVDVLVATPGRLLDLHQQNLLDLSTVQILVLDEADRMLDMGFIHDVKKVLALLPQSKQSLLFSATFSDDIRELANNLLKNPQSIQVTPRNTTVERIDQVVHPVGREKKKALLAHLINQNNWSQVLVFTRTKFGANGVAEFLTQNGISAMALHGNKSQTARTQALAGFKSGELRALVATDIAARGIDIDELPHVVNFDIPNISEDYVHRIGRTGRAGASGQAVSFVSLDEEGFMLDIEKFTNQKVPVQSIEGYGPEPDEIAQPIAMGRQTLWGGLGKPPSREVMAAAAKAARAEMMQRIRENKASQGQRQSRHETGEGNSGSARAPRPNGHVSRDRKSDRPQNQQRMAPRQQRHATGFAPRPIQEGFVPTEDFNTTNSLPVQPHQGQERNARNQESRTNQRRGGGGRGFGNTPRNNEPRDHFNKQGAKDTQPHHQRSHDDEDDDFYQPRANAHLGTQSGVNAFGHKNKGNSGRQPDPTMTSIDLMSTRKHGGGGFGGNNRRGGGNNNRGGNGNGGGGGRSSGSGGNRRGGGGFSR
jgi:ATP-dependent RNA helicase RhlE